MFVCEGRASAYIDALWTRGGGSRHRVLVRKAAGDGIVLLFGRARSGADTKLSEHLYGARVSLLELHRAMYTIVTILLHMLTFLGNVHRKGLVIELCGGKRHPSFVCRGTQFVGGEGQPQNAGELNAPGGIQKSAKEKNRCGPSLASLSSQHEAPCNEMIRCILYV